MSQYLVSSGASGASSEHILCSGGSSLADGGAGGAPAAFLVGSEPIISNEMVGADPDSQSIQRLTSSGLKTRFCLEFIVFALIARYGRERLGFLTLTFGDHVVSAKEASRRFNSLRTGVLARRYSEVVRVCERQRSGRIHFHLLVVCSADIRRGLDFAALARRDYRSACPALRAEWSFWRGVAPRYGFGRCELLPIRKGARDLSSYVGKYVAKHCARRTARDRGVRLVSCSRRARVATTRFSWSGGYAARFRRGCPLLLSELVRRCELPCADDESARRYFGKHWRYRFRETIGRLADGLSVGADFEREVSREWRRSVL